MALSAGATVLITGANGFTGRYMQAKLQEQGYKVVGLVNEQSDSDQVVADLTNLEALRSIFKRVRPEYVIHLAAISFADYSDQAALYQVNLFGTLNLLQAVRDNNIVPEKILIASSANVYGNPVNSEKVSESLCPAPVNHYAMSKLAMEHMLQSWHQYFDIIITRPFNYTGVGQDAQFLVPKVVKHFSKKSQVIKLGNTDVVRELNDVRFVTDVYYKLLISPIKNEIINVCTGRGYSLQQLLDTMHSLSGHQIDIEIDPSFVRANELKVLVGDNTKLNNLLGTLPDIELETTLEWMLVEA